MENTADPEGGAGVLGVPEAEERGAEGANTTL